MKVYIVRRGWDNEDCSPIIQHVFATRESAVTSVEIDVKNTLKEYQKDLTWKVRMKDTGPECWSFECLMKGWKGWIEDEVWLIEEHIVLG